MKKVFYIICFLLVAGNAKAMDFNQDLTGQIDMIRMSDEFVRQMQSCTPFIEHKEADAEGHSFNYEYKVQGWVDGKCKCDFSSFSQIGSFVNNCAFSPENLRDYTNALISYNKKSKHSIEDMSDTDYLTAMAIIFDPEICQMTTKTDYTAELRENLKSCTPYEKTLNFSNMDNTMKVAGKEGDKCHYLYLIQNKPVDLNKIYPDGVPEVLKDLPQVGSSSTFDCLLSDSDVAEYTASLQQSAITVENGLDWNSGNAEAASQKLQEFTEKGICKISADFGGMKLDI